MSTSSDGTTVLGGAPGLGQNVTGIVFHASAESTWTTVTTPTAVLESTAGGGNNSVNAVALTADGKVSFVTAPGSNPSGNEGLAAVFTASAESSWSSSTTPAAQLSGPGVASPGPNSALGASVVLSADGTVALASGSGSGSPFIYVFLAPSQESWSSTMVPTAKLIDNTLGNSGFGHSLALSSDGTTAFVGTEYVNQVDIFHVSAETAWSTTSTPTAVLTNSASTSGDEFGLSLGRVARWYDSAHRSPRRQLVDGRSLRIPGRLGELMVQPIYPEGHAEPSRGKRLVRISGVPLRRRHDRAGRAGRCQHERWSRFRLPRRVGECVRAHRRRPPPP